MASPALSFVAGLASGYNSQQQRNIENARAAAADQRAQDLHDIQMKNAQRDQDLQVALANAARPAQVDVGAGGVTKPDTADNIDVGQLGEPGGDGGPALQQGTLVNGQPAADPAVAAAAYNDPSAITLRQVQAYAQAGRPVDAMNLQKGAFQLSKDQQEYARTLQSENAFDTAKALRTGDPQTIKDAFNKSGDWKIVGDPTVVPKQRTDIPGLPAVTTYDVTVNLKGPDGQTMTKTVNSHDFSMSVLPYEKAMELEQKGTQNEALADVRGQVADAREATARAQQTAADAKQAAVDAQAARLKDMPDAQERIALTTMANNAQREIRSLRQDIAKHQLDFGTQIRNNPTGPEAKQLSDMQAELKQHQTAYANANSALSTWMTHGRTPATAPAPGPTPGAPPAKPSTQQEYNALPKGTSYIAPDGTTRIKS